VQRDDKLRDEQINLPFGGSDLAQPALTHHAVCAKLAEKQ
jgi:hypothetical protein